MQFNEYGIKAELNNELIIRLESIASKKFVAHDSLYKGDYWLYKNDNGNSIELRHNKDPLYKSKIDPPEELFFDFEYKQCNSLLSISGDPLWVTELHELVIKISSVIFIESNTITQNAT